MLSGRLVRQSGGSSLPDLATVTASIESQTPFGYLNRYCFGAEYSPDGTTVHVHDELEDKIYKQTMSTAWDLSTLSNSISVGSAVMTQGATSLIHLSWNNDGTRLYVIDYSNGDVDQYDCTTAYDSASFSTGGDGSYYLGSAGWGGGLDFSPDGTFFYVFNAFQKPERHSMSTPWDVTTASVDNIDGDDMTEDTSKRALLWDETGTRVWALGSTNDKIYQYTASVPFIFSKASITYDTATADISADANQLPLSMKWNNNSLYIQYYSTTINQDMIRQYVFT